MMQNFKQLIDTRIQEWMMWKFANLLMQEFAIYKMEQNKKELIDTNEELKEECWYG